MSFPVGANKVCLIVYFRLSISFIKVVSLIPFVGATLLDKV